MHADVVGLGGRKVHPNALQAARRGHEDGRRNVGREHAVVERRLEGLWTAAHDEGRVRRRRGRCAADRAPARGDELVDARPRGTVVQPYLPRLPVREPSVDVRAADQVARHDAEYARADARRGDVVEGDVALQGTRSDGRQHRRQRAVHRHPHRRAAAEC